MDKEKWKLVAAVTLGLAGVGLIIVSIFDTDLKGVVQGGCIVIIAVVIGAS